ncbi:GNAT family N-acetyltransferase [bacterium]|nr:GNAT family N-acetyltransferase [bacterium]
MSTNKEKLDIEMIHTYLSEESYWAKGRSIQKVKVSIENSMCFGVYNGEQQVGFARVITDHAIFAWVLDVFILPEYRGKGLGKKLMSTIVNHPELQELGRWGLGTDDAHGLYQQFGFKALENPDKMMEKK